MGGENEVLQVRASCLRSLLHALRPYCPQVGKWTGLSYCPQGCSRNVACLGSRLDFQKTMGLVRERRLRCTRLALACPQPRRGHQDRSRPLRLCAGTHHVYCVLLPARHCESVRALANTNELLASVGITRNASNHLHEIAVRPRTASLEML